MRVAREEWRYWSRSRVGVAATVVVLLLVVTSLGTTLVRVEAERETRLRLQAAAEEAFRSQPARHPHRMVHYGHYVFRAPAPLAIADPGVDPFTGTVMFLEGHRQNSATLAPHYTRAEAGAYATLSLALAYQLLVPLLLIMVGFASLSREREARTDQIVFTMAVSPVTFWLGKSIALAVLALASLIPLALIAAFALISGESAGVTLAFWVGYAVYLLCWVFLVTAGSVWCKQASSSLLLLLICWVALCILVPPSASSTAGASVQVAGKVHDDLQIARTLRDMGDGHNPSDPAFAKLRAQLLAQYGVESIEALPVNFRGVVAGVAEKDLTEVLNRFATERARLELAQAEVASAFSALSPYLALKSFSTTLASTDLRHHHQFLRDAEDLRFSFIQGLNQVHAH